MMRNEVIGRSKPMYPWDRTIERTGVAGRDEFAMLIANSPFQRPNDDARGFWGDGDVTGDTLWRDSRRGPER